jgi:hypothetical protein
VTTDTTDAPEPTIPVRLTYNMAMPQGQAGDVMRLDSARAAAIVAYGWAEAVTESYPTVRLEAP